jgi:hypothetical protein
LFVLIEANLESLRGRYGFQAQDEVEYAQSYSYNPKGEKLSNTALLRLLDSYQYQCDGADTWENSEAKKWTDDLKNLLVRSLPGYGEAPWTI